LEKEGSAQPDEYSSENFSLNGKKYFADGKNFSRRGCSEGTGPSEVLVDNFLAVV
jgi:hypothetical protein